MTPTKDTLEAFNPRRFDVLNDRRAWTEIQKDAGYWQRFYDYAQVKTGQDNRVTRGSR